jgi:hypothetical protein
LIGEAFLFYISFRYALPPRHACSASIALFSNLADRQFGMLLRLQTQASIELLVSDQLLIYAQCADQRR